MGSYCRAFYARDFAAFDGWRPDLAQLRDAGAPLEDDHILYLQEDFGVTDGIFQDENVVFADAGMAWRTYCAGVLGFAPPAELEEELADAAA